MSTVINFSSSTQVWNRMLSRANGNVLLVERSLVLARANQNGKAPNERQVYEAMDHIMNGSQFLPVHRQK